MVVGPLVEDVVEFFGSASSSVSYTGSGYDYAINDLTFKLAITDEHPYQRATAQFRKDQFDTGQQVGDQSLTGWWTRGQFSFHKGAGVTYYEVSEGETVLNRFDDAEGLDPFEPGRVVCQKTWSAYSTAVAALSYVSAVGDDLVVLDGTTVKYGDFNGTPSTYAPAGGTTVRSVTTSPALVYALLADGKIASVDPTTDTETTLYSGLSTTGRGIWYVKSRLIVSDSDGKWYQLATNPATPPVAVAAGDVVFTAGSEWATDSVVCDTPGPILIGNDNRIFACTLDSAGTIPALTAPVQVAELPPGEIISAIAYHLGFVVLVTGAGVRIGVLSDNGQVTFGPLLVERSAATITPPDTSIARYSTRVSAVVDNRIIEIDLAQQIGNGLEFAWTGRGEPYSSPTAAGVTTIGYSTQVAWAGDGLWASTANALAGYVQTGLHRFATLEPKRFSSVRVHCEGASGTVAVSKVSAAGAETSLYTIDVATDHVKEIDLREDDGIEAIGLKFTLTPDAGAPTVSPVLLGYQLRALPDPQRQRIIRVPLLMNDIERRSPARTAGRSGSAWSRLRELEDLEEAQAVVTYRDLRTSESGSAFVEAVEFVNTTPPTNNSTGFGGVCNVTLRRV